MTRELPNFTKQSRLYFVKLGFLFSADFFTSCPSLAAFRVPLKARIGTHALQAPEGVARLASKKAAGEIVISERALKQAGMDGIPAPENFNKGTRTSTVNAE